MGIGMANPAHSAAIHRYEKKVGNESVKNVKTNNAGSIMKGSAIAATAGMGISSAYSPIATSTMNGIAKMQGKLSAEQTKLLNDAGEKILDITNMRSKGVSIENVDSFINLTGMPDKLAEQAIPIIGIANGKNAGFVPKANNILVNKNKAAALQFHELGHAYNHNVSKVWNVIQKCRVPAMVASFGLILFAACTKDAVAKDGEELTKAQKTKNFVRHNAGKLAFSTMLPVLAEEGMASIRGCKWAKEMLSKEMFKHVTKTNALAYTTYVGSAVALGLAALGAVKIKNHFTEKKVQNTQQSEQSQQNNITENKVD